MSRTWGIFSRVTLSSVRIAAAMQGRAEFLAPDMRTVPTSGFPPRITNLSIKTKTPGLFSLRPGAHATSTQRGCGISGANCNQTSCRLQFENVVLNGQTHIPIRLGQPANSFRLIDFGFQHHKRYRNTAARAFDRLHSRRSIDAACAHQDANASLDKLGILHVDRKSVG